jgi:hypothetical protein
MKQNQKQQKQPGEPLTGGASSRHQLHARRWRWAKQRRLEKVIDKQNERAVRKVCKRGMCVFLFLYFNGGD